MLRIYIRAWVYRRERTIILGRCSCCLCVFFVLTNKKNVKRERKERERKQTFAFGGVQKEKKAEKAETPQRDRKKRKKIFCKNETKILLSRPPQLEVLVFFSRWVILLPRITTTTTTKASIKSCNSSHALSKEAKERSTRERERALLIQNKREFRERIRNVFFQIRFSCSNWHLRQRIRKFTFPRAVV